MTGREWLTLAEAARVLGIAPRTARRWLHAGRLSGELRPGPHGPQYYLPIDEVQAVREEILAATEQAPMLDPPGIAQLRLVVEEIVSKPLNELRADLNHARGEVRQDLGQLRRDLSAIRADLARLTAEVARLRAARERDRQ